jgi:lipopolysaccharide/colanic/teichoic acid biosynthesis glycosyltransferase
LNVASRFPADFSAAAAVASAREGVRDYSRLRIGIYAVLLGADALLMGAGFVLADFLRAGNLAEGYGLSTFGLLFPLYLAIGCSRGAWSIEALANPRRSAALAAQILGTSVAVATVLLFSLKVGEDFSRLVFGFGAVFSGLLISLGRLRLGKIIGERRNWTFRKEVLLIDGVAAESGGTAIVIDAAEARIIPDAGDPMMHDRLARILDRSERIVVACPAERRAAWGRMLAGANADVEIIVPELESLGALALGSHSERPTLLVSCGPLNLRDRVIKRGFDSLLSFAMLILLAPVFVVIAAAIRLDSPGPILFRQDRMGRGNRLFQVLKFRTMRAEASDCRGDRSTAREDERITRVGSFLRRTSLDELPQLLNVLKGEMSMVGPRPHTLGSRAEDALFWTIERRYFDRHAIKPGITGLAQVRGFRGATWKRSDLSDRLHADLEYLRGWHLGRDLAILLRTGGVLIHPNAF